MQGFFIKDRDEFKALLGNHTSRHNDGERRVHNVFKDLEDLWNGVNFVDKAIWTTWGRNLKNMKLIGLVLLHIHRTVIRIQKNYKYDRFVLPENSVTSESANDRICTRVLTSANGILKLLQNLKRNIKLFWWK